MRINIGLNDKQRGGVITVLNTLLADEFVLYTKTRRFHWNVTGPNFSELHRFFDEQYQLLAEIVDEVAERPGGQSVELTDTLGDFIDDVRQELVLLVEKTVQLAEVGTGDVPVKASGLGEIGRAHV